MFARPSWFRYARNAAPKITPQTLPMPPRMTIDRMKAEMLKLKSFGNDELLNDAKYAPATPPKNAPVAYAHVFVRISGIPIAAAAVSSSRIAIHARPRREYCRRSEVKTVITRRMIATQKKTSVDWTWCPRCDAVQHVRKFA